ncbi:MAG: HIT domain-containing protein [Anaerolineales bacterium]|nr:HIT domain-containing protein [Anaerolineales bacterium]
MNWLLRLARSLPAGWFIGWVFAHMSFAIPTKRLRETNTLVAFPHPSPTYPVHILLVPKKAVKSLTDLDNTDGAFLADLFQTVQSLVGEMDLESTGYRLIANGGKYQDVEQLHFHLVSGDPLN